MLFENESTDLEDSLKKSETGSSTSNNSSEISEEPKADQDNASPQVEDEQPEADTEDSGSEEDQKVEEVPADSQTDTEEVKDPYGSDDSSAVVQDDTLLQDQASTDETASDSKNPLQPAPIQEAEVADTSQDQVSPSAIEQDSAIEQTTAAQDEEVVKQETPAEQSNANDESQMWEGWGALDTEQEGLLQKVDEIIDEEQSARLLDASPEDLIVLLEKYVEGDISDNIPKVGLLKRSFDAIRAQLAVSEELTEQFRVALANFNKKRVELQKAQEAQKAENAKKKRTLIDRLKAIVDSEDVYKIKEVREVQNEWKNIGHIPKKDMESMYMEYRTLLDTFYQRREMHFELLEYDRKINLQEKEKLIEEAKTLIPPLEDRENMTVWTQKMDHFREIQEQWKNIGHVPKEDLDRIRDEFRTVIDQFFEARQQFLKVLDTQRDENQKKKEALLIEMEQYAEFTAKRPREWNEATQTFRALQEQWKALGPAPKSVNNELWQKYRNIADKFFSNKTSYFKQLDEKRSENLIKKQELCERAEELRNSPDWEKTARELKKLQNEWNQSGPVPERYSNKIWSRFKTACDKFFEQRRLHYQALHETEHINLEKKKKLIEEVVKLAEDEEKDVDLAIERVKELQSEWREIGKVPYKEKDKIWEEFRREIDRFFNSLSGKREKLREIRLKTSIETIADPDQRSRQIKAKIARIRKKVRKSEEKIEQYSNNMMFIAKGKSGEPLRIQIQAELDREKEQVDEWKGKVKMLNEMLKNPPENMSDDDDDDDDNDNATNEMPVNQEEGKGNEKTHESGEEDASSEGEDAETVVEADDQRGSKPS